MIVIIGDSWGVGEYSNCNLSGPGFGQYLMLHDRVTNLSVGAASNTLCLDRLQDFLERYRLDVYDSIYWIVTCPSRCSNGPQYFVDSGLSILDTARDLLYQTLDRGNQLAETYHTHLQLIGGLCDLDWLSTEPWSHISVRVPSWSQLIQPDHPTGIINPHWWPELGAMIKQDHLNLMPEWLAVTDNIVKRQRSWDRIFPTDRCHPDRHGHLILRDHLYPGMSFKV